MLAAAAWPARAAEAMRVGIETNADPMSFVNAKGKADGFTVDLIEAIAAEMKIPLIPTVAAWENLFSGFNRREIDVLVSLAYTPERDEFIDFAVSHFAMKGAFFVNTKNARGLRHIEDLPALRLAVQRQSFAHEYAMKHNWDQHLVFVPTLRDALHALDEGKCDVVLAVGIIGAQIMRKDGLRNLEMSNVTPLDLSYDLHMGVHAGDASRLALLNAGLAKVRANGKYDLVYEKWIGPLEPRQMRLKDLRPYFLPVLILVAAGVGCLAWQRRILRRMAAQTAALRASEERLSLVFEVSEEGFWYWDLATKLIDRSPRAAAMLGYTPAELGNTLEKWVELIHPDDVVRLPSPADFLAAIERGEQSQFDLEYRMMDKAGEWRWIHTKGKVVAQSPTAKPTRMAGTSKDVTDRKRTETALRESQQTLKRSTQLLEQTQSAAQVGGWEIDLRTDRLFWTEETYRIHEISPDHFTPTIENAVNFYAPADRARISAAVDRTIREGTSYELEMEIVTGQQRRIRVSTTGHAEFEQGRVVKLYGSIRDITDQKTALREREELQLKMLEAQKLESLGVLAGGIAHDFNNLLTVILANAAFLRVETAAPAIRDGRLGLIEDAARRAADMCRQMLAYAGRSTLLSEHVNLSTLVQDTARLLLVSISKKARIDLALDPRLPPVEADSSQLRQVVINLVLNASEALADGAGTIRVATRLARPETLPGALVHAFDLPAGECVCLEVTDSGAGMNPEMLARIFDPFFTTKFTGRGLGLAAVLGIVRAHHGALAVASTPGQGTTFRVYLQPAAGAAWTSAPKVIAGETDKGKVQGTVLVADDEPIVLSTADALLRHRGYKTVLATDGIEAVRLFRANPTGFAAVLLDLTMPGLNGAEALREIRAINADARILLMTGYSAQDVLARLENQPGVVILHKPFTHDSLFARISEVAATPVA